jgi:hypothetical protein
MELSARILGLCLALAAVETLHAIARMRLLVPRLGKRRAVRWSIVSGSLLALGVRFLFVPAMDLRHPGALLALGAGLAVFMAAFDVVVARLLMRRPWPAVAADFDPRQGNLLLLGLVFLALAPLLVMSLARGE